MSRKIEQTLLYLSFFLTLCFCYSGYIYPVWGYYGFPREFDSTSLQNTAVASILVAFLASSLPSRLSRPSDFLLHVHFLLPILPMFAMFAMTDLPLRYVVAVAIAFVILIYVGSHELRFRLRVEIPRRVLVPLLLMVVLIQILLVVHYVGLKYLSFDIWRVYEHRRDIAELLPSYIQYLIPWCTKVILPVLLVIALLKKQWWLVSFTIALQVLEFGLTQHKSPMFFPFVVAGVYFLSRRKRPVRGLVFLFILLGMLPLTIEYLGSVAEGASGLLVRRAMFTPALANFGYFLFFEVNPKIYMSNSIFTLGLVDYPYDQAYQLMFKKGTWANTGWLGTSYMHFGYFGMGIYATILGLVLSTLNYLGRGKPAWYVPSLAVVPMFTVFTSADLPTSMLTHGIFLLIIILSTSSEWTQQRIEYRGARENSGVED